jgi:hypothetical protein
VAIADSNNGHITIGNNGQITSVNN